MSEPINGSLTPRQAIPRQTLTTAVADRLRNKILRGELREGTQLRQHAIAEEFAVSRIPLREAMRQLEAEGLIEIQDHRGAVVTALSAEEIQELFEIRAVLESLTLRRAVPHLTAAHLTRAEAALQAYEHALNHEADFDVWGDLHWQFHSALYAAANRGRSLALIQTVNNNADRYIRLHILFSHAAHRNAKDEHRTILELCRQRKAAAASRLLEEHIAKAGRELKEFMQQGQ
ncbi:MAG: GntR family transcriptional regulator [Acidobacteria bacterium]|nr:GntR family transcriptional regulator [Acidobacteriota bacterium]MBI3424830.1 GntR family transcriptional regulator [Acidobacteriota bacterium]